MNPNDNYDEKADMTFMERHKVVLSVVAVAIVATGVFVLHGIFLKKSSQENKEQKIVWIPVPPQSTPAPSATPTPQVVEKEEKMTVVPPIGCPVDKPIDKQPETPHPITTNITGNGDSPYNLTRGAGSDNKKGGIGQNGSEFDWFFYPIQRSIHEALTKDPRTKNASFDARVHIWLDITGRITRTKVTMSKDDPKIDEAINEIVTGMQFRDAAPRGVDMPIVLHFTGNRPVL